MPRSPLVLFALVVWVGTARAADGPTKEPAYTSKAPRYGRLAFGPAPAEQVWLVIDGDTLYVDRNADGDLTGPGEAVRATARPAGADDGNRTFEAGEVTVAGRTHKGLAVYLTPLANYGTSITGRSDVKRILAQNPKAVGVSVGVDVDWPGLKATGAGGRLGFSAGPTDLNGVLQFATKPADAPVVRLDRPLEVTLYGYRPALRIGRPTDLTLVVGTPGDGPGTFASLAYRDTIPKTAFPTVAVAYPPAKAGDAPVKEQYELKERC